MLSIYDQPDALVITDGTVELYLDVSEFADRDDVAPVGNYNKKPDYLKKKHHKAGDICAFQDIEPAIGMIIMDPMLTVENFTYVKEGHWRCSNDGILYASEDFIGGNSFRIIHVGER